jgi:cell fate (sporulation/competence/biofilm development) regulator YlbF (YheA/YmcA/DUF963 family)
MTKGPIMDILTNSETSVLDKTKELCSCLSAEPGFQKYISDIERFESDTGAQRQYNDLLNLQDQLQKKQSMGNALSNEETSEFEDKRTALLSNEVAAGFLEAQQQIQKVQQMVLQYLNKTFELGRVPTDEEVNAGGCCGGGCGGGSCGSC